MPPQSLPEAFPSLIVMSIMPSGGFAISRMGSWPMSCLMTLSRSFFWSRISSSPFVISMSTTGPWKVTMPQIWLSAVWYAVMSLKPEEHLGVVLDHVVVQEVQYLWEP